MRSCNITCIFKCVSNKKLNNYCTTIYISDYAVIKPLNIYMLCEERFTEIIIMWFNQQKNNLVNQKLIKARNLSPSYVCQYVEVCFFNLFSYMMKLRVYVSACVLERGRVKREKCFRSWWRDRHLFGSIWSKQNTPFTPFTKLPFIISFSAFSACYTYIYLYTHTLRSGNSGTTR